jgi:hypothetical protein
MLSVMVGVSQYPSGGNAWCCVVNKNITAFQEALIMIQPEFWSGVVAF